MSQHVVIIKTRDGWSRSRVGENNPRSYKECEADIEALRHLGDEWADAEYDIEEVNDEGLSTRGLQFVE